MIITGNNDFCYMLKFSDSVRVDLTGLLKELIASCYDILLLF